MSIASKTSVLGENPQLYVCKTCPKTTLANLVFDFTPGKVLKLLGISGLDKYALE